GGAVERRERELLGHRGRAADRLHVPFLAGIGDGRRSVVAAPEQQVGDDQRDHREARHDHEPRALHARLRTPHDAPPATSASNPPTRKGRLSGCVAARVAWSPTESASRSKAARSDAGGVTAANACRTSGTWPCAPRSASPTLAARSSLTCSESGASSSI